MRYFSIFSCSIFTVIIFACCFSTNKLNTSKKRMFNYHFKILDSASNASKNDTIHCCYQSIRFMEAETKITSTAMTTYFGIFSFRKEDLQMWHDWYKKSMQKNLAK